MMQKKEYKDFSLAIHRKTWAQNKPVVCQFELTFICPLHCRYCYSDCYNTRAHSRKELKTRQVLKVLDKLHRFGILWLTFTGGDPLSRKDFSRIYSYAREKGFIVSIFTSGMLIDKALIGLFRRYKPFCVEVTLNTLDSRLQDSLSGVPGSLGKIISAVEALKKARIPFKIKTMVTSENAGDIKKVKAFSLRLGVEQQLSSTIFPRLDGDRTPCLLRLEPQALRRSSQAEADACLQEGASLEYLFRCNAGSDAFHVDPCGKMFLCTTVRTPRVCLLDQPIERGLELFRKVVEQKFRTTSPCRRCRLWRFCDRCPGRALLETKDMHSPVDYFCQAARVLASGKENHAKN